MKITKNILGKVKSIEISPEELQSFILDETFMSATIMRFLYEQFKIKWIFPKEEKQHE